MPRIPFRLPVTPVLEAAKKAGGTRAAGAFGLESFLGRFIHANPEISMFTAVGSRARVFAENMFRKDFAQAKNLNAEISKQGIELDYDLGRDVLLGSLREKGDSLWHKYRRRIVDSPVADIPSQNAIANIEKELAQRGFKGRGFFKSGKPYLSRTEFMNQAAKQRRRFSAGQAGSSGIPEVDTLARAYGDELFEPIRKRGIAQGVLREEIEKAEDFVDSYVAQMWDMNTIHAFPNRFLEVSTNYFNRFRGRIINRAEDRIQHFKGKLKAAKTEKEKKSAQEAIARWEKKLTNRQSFDAEKAARQFMNDLDSDGRLGMHPTDVNTLGVSARQKTRKIRIPKDMLEEFEPFLENDIERISYGYVRSMLPRILYQERFGKPGAKESADQILNRLIKESDTEYDELRLSEGLSPTDRSLLDLEKRRMRNYLRSQSEVFFGQYKLPENPYGVLHRISESFLRFNLITKLGQVTLSSLPDMARHVARYGLANTGRLMFNMASNPAFTGLAAKDMKRTIGIYETILQSRLFERAEIDRGFVPLSGFERMLKRATDSFGNVTLISQWNQIQKQFSAMSAASMVLDQASRKNISKKILNRFAEGGIGRKELDRMNAQFKQFGLEHNGIFIPQTANWIDKEIAQIFNNFIRREVEISITTPGMASRPLWTHSGLGKHAGQFKSFAFTSTNSILLSGLQQAEMQQVNGLIIMLTLGALVYQGKEVLAGREPSKDPNVLLAEGIDRSGILGWISDASNILERASRGTIGINTMLGGPGASRYRTFDLWKAIGGPTAGALGDISRVFGATSTFDWNDGDVKSFRRMVPYQNLFYIRFLFNQMEKGLQRKLGAQ